MVTTTLTSHIIVAGSFILLHSPHFKDRICQGDRKGIYHALRSFHST
ncbi:protein of unknown function [Brochothrix thermosphacta]|nr:protein of unknown function [Brochothrix thermosphacta]SPP29581.1 hypothetical protein BTTAP_40062 [Brochothrix thermosphacta]